MKRVIIILALLFSLRAEAHVGSPDVFLDGDAGPYKLSVAIRAPEVIPGVATIEIRADGDDLRDVTVVPMRLTGPGSQLPPVPDHADRSAVDPRFFTASLWLMERGSLQVRIAVTGDRGEGTLAVPVPAMAQRTLAMPGGLGVLLIGLMCLLAFAIVAIVAGAFREAALDEGILPSARDRLRARLVALGAGAGVLGLIALGNAWWNAEARAYDELVLQPWHLVPRVDGCRLALPPVNASLLPDHGHDMHLFLVRVPALDQLVHVHPQPEDGLLVQQLPTLPAGHYQLFGDIVLDTGFPVTGTAELDLPALTRALLAGDDAAWAGHGDAATSQLADGTKMIWDRPPALHANEAVSLRFRVVGADGAPVELEPYMGMMGHAEILRTDAKVFAHIHPSGTVAMPALALANGAATHHHHHHVEALAFPYGFPQAGTYRVFVQVKHAGQILTGAFDATVDQY